MDKALAARVITMIIMWINTLFASQGIQLIPFGGEDIYLIVSLIITLGVSAWSFWKNNNFTTASKKAQEVLEELKVEKTLELAYCDNRMDEEDVKAYSAEIEKEGVE